MRLGPNLLPPPRAWQSDELAIPGARRNVFASPRTGKTMFSALWLRSLAERGVERIVVSAPLRVCPLWVETLQAAGLPTHDLFSKPASHGARVLSSTERGVMVVNVDKLAPLRAELCRYVQAYVCDEVHETAAPQSGRGRAARAVAKAAEFYRGLTGTPVANHHGSLWSPLHMAGAFSGAWGKFMDRYTVRDRYFPSKVISHIRQDELMELMLSCSSIVRREDVFGPDTFETITRTVQLPTEARRLYQSLAKAWVAEVGGKLIDGTHPLARQMRLQQLASGIAVTDEGDETIIHGEKIAAALTDLGEIIESGEKAVVFHRFRLEGQHMVEALRHRDVPTFAINGSFDGPASEAQRAAFTALDGPAVMVAQIRSGGVGISLAEATHALYLSRTFSFIEDEQSRDRIYKPGARRTVTYYNAANTIDTFIAKALAQKRDVHDAVRGATKEEQAYGA